MKKGIAFGDSIIKGVVLDKNGSEGIHYSAIEDNFAEQCGKRLGMAIDNYGRFGCTVTVGEKILNRHLDQIVHSDFTFLEYGGNDCDFKWPEIGADPSKRHEPNTDLRTFSLTYKSLIDKVRNLGSRPVMFSLIPLVSDRYFAHVTRDMDMEGRRKVLKWLGGDTEGINNWHEIYNLQIFKLGLALNVPVIDITTTFLSKKCFQDYMCADGIHPNEKGHRLIADAVCDLFKNKRIK